MDRVPEPELMNDDAQAKAYAYADFSSAHDMFINLFREKFPRREINDAVLDLGCGPCDISRRFVQAYPDAYIHGIDGAAAMLKYGNELNIQSGLSEKIKLVEGCIPGIKFPQNSYHTIISNSLLHHLHNPSDLWQAIKQHAKPFAAVFVMDLFRPVDKHTVDFLVREYAANEAEILQQDFSHSLQAAYSVDEVKQQLDETGLTKLKLDVVSDRHFIVYGEM